MSAEETTFLDKKPVTLIASDQHRKQKQTGDARIFHNSTCDTVCANAIINSFLQAQEHTLHKRYVGQAQEMSHACD